MFLLSSVILVIFVFFLAGVCQFHWSQKTTFGFVDSFVFLCFTSDLYYYFPSDSFVFSLLFFFLVLKLGFWLELFLLLGGDICNYKHPSEHDLTASCKFWNVVCFFPFIFNFWFLLWFFLLPVGCLGLY